MDLDITIGRNGQHIDYGPTYYQRELADGSYHLFQQNSIEKIGQNTYRITEYPIDIHGQIDTNYSGEGFDPNTFLVTRIASGINTNWKLFTEIFGGYRSLSMRNGTLEYSENSIKQMVQAINNVGYKKDREHGYD